MKFKKKLMMKTMGILFASSLIATPIIACSTKDNNQNSNNNDSNKPSTNPGGNGTGTSGNGDGSSSGGSGTGSGSGSGSGGGGSSQTTPATPSTVDNTIKEASDFSKVDFQNDASNTAGITQNVSDFITNGNFQSYVGNKTDLSKDVLVFFYNLSKQYKNLNIKNSNVANLSTKTQKGTETTTPDNENTSDQNLILNDTAISFKMSASIESSINQEIIIAGKKVKLEKGKTNIIAILVDNQVIKPIIANYNNENYLSWKVDDAKFELNNDSWQAKDYSFNEGQPSHAFKYKFNNLTSGYTYFDLKQKHENDAYNISNEQLEKEVTNQIDTAMESNIKFADYATSILRVLKEDIPIDTMVKKLSPTLINILVDTKLVPENLMGFLMDALYGKENGSETISDVPFIKALDGHQEEAAQFIASLIHMDDSSLIQFVLTMLKPGMKVTDEAYIQMMKILGGIEINGQKIPESTLKIITGDILGVTSPAKPIINILFDNYKTIFSLIKEFGITNDTINTIEQILDLILAKKPSDAPQKEGDQQQNQGSQQQYQSIYDAIFGSKESKEKFVNLIKKFVSFTPEVEKIVSILVINNESLNKQNVIEVVKSLYNFMKGFFELNPDSKSFNDKYKNLTFTKKENRKVTLNKENKTIDFDYQFDFVLNKVTTLDFKPFKNLITNDSVEQLLGYLVEKGDTGWTDVIKQAIKTIGVEQIKNAFLKIIPDTLEFGKEQNKNKLIFDFSSNNGKTWFGALNVDGKYNAGFSFEYNMNIKHDDLGLIDSITNNYKKSTQTLIDKFIAVLYGDYSNFWRSIIQNVLYRDYDVSLKMSVDSKKEIATTETYNSSQIYQNYNFENYVNLAGNGDFIIDNVLSTEPTNYKDVFSSFDAEKKYQWSDDKQSEKIVGKKPIFSQDQYTKIKNRMFTFNPNMTDYSLTLNPIFNMELSLNLKIEIFFGATIKKIDIKVKTMVTNVDLYFPFKVLDTVTNKSVDHVAKTITYFNFDYSLT